MVYFNTMITIKNIYLFGLKKFKNTTINLVLNIPTISFSISTEIIQNSVNLMLKLFFIISMQTCIT